MSNNKYEFIYIMGRGHSGSTLLDTVLGNSKKIESIGELISGLLRYQRQKCSCGRMVEDCNFWRDAVKNYISEGGDFQDFKSKTSRQAHLKYFIETFFLSKKYKELVEENKRMGRAIAKINEKELVLDSSKEITRALMLVRNKHNLIIHLVRNPIGIAGSSYHRIRKGDELVFLRHKFKVKKWFIPFYMVFVGWFWSFGNLLAEIVKMRSKGNVVQIRYEDFLSNPERVLSSLGEKLGISLDELVRKIQDNEDFYIGHNIAGNGFRFKKSFKVELDRKLHKLPSFYAFLIKLTNFPSMIYYRYFF